VPSILLFEFSQIPTTDYDLSKQIQKKIAIWVCAYIILIRLDPEDYFTVFPARASAGGFGGFGGHVLTQNLAKGTR
jgi:hypothetical protein